MIKPPKYGNCTISSDTKPATLISISELKTIYGNKCEGKSAKYLQKIQQKLDTILQYDDWEADDIIDPPSEHDYTLSPILDCIIYYVTGFVFLITSFHVVCSWSLLLLIQFAKCRHSSEK